MVVAPLSSQQAVDAEAKKWGQEWLAGRLVQKVEWPTDGQETERLAQLSCDVLEKAIRTFPDASRLWMGLAASEGLAEMLEGGALSRWCFSSWQSSRGENGRRTLAW